MVYQFWGCVLYHVCTSQPVDVNEYCCAKGDKLGLAGHCNGKELQAEFWSCKWSYIRQPLLFQNFWH